MLLSVSRVLALFAALGSTLFSWCFHWLFPRGKKFVLQPVDVTRGVCLLVILHMQLESSFGGSAPLRLGCPVESPVLPSDCACRDCHCGLSGHPDSLIPSVLLHHHERDPGCLVEAQLSLPVPDTSPCLPHSPTPAGLPVHLSTVLAFSRGTGAARRRGAYSQPWGIRHEWGRGISG